MAQMNFRRFILLCTLFSPMAAICQDPPPCTPTHDQFTIMRAAYNLVLKRPAHDDEVAFYSKVLTDTVSVREVLIALVETDEWQAKYHYSAREEAAALYPISLARPADSGGLDAYSNAISSQGLQAALKASPGIAFSPEADKLGQRISDTGVCWDERPITQEISEQCGAPQRTQELHNVHCPSSGRDTGCECHVDQDLCFMKTALEVRTPNTRDYKFVGKPYLKCTKDNDGSCAWNYLGDKLHLEINNTTLVQGYALTNSHSITIAACVNMQHYPPE